MTRTLVLVSCLAALCLASGTATAASAVFDGDPIDPATGLPYEILPGLPLVAPGADGLLGTADDVIDTSRIGDIDMVVRAGSPTASPVIPPPAARGGALPVGVAGPSSAGGTEIPFTVFLSDGAATSGAPYGSLLSAVDMDGIPVVVAAFADLDGDGVVGPTDADGAGGADNGLEVRELEAVGRAVAVFSGGVAQGSLAVSAGAPVSRGGLTIALTAVALTGPFDPNFFDGNVPTGPAISTALPFLPERNLSRLIRDRAAAVGPATTLQQVVQFAAVPSPSAAVPLALRLDGSVPTIDAAVVYSQAAVGVAFYEEFEGPGVHRVLSSLALGTRPPPNWLPVRLLPVDRWGNPSDAPGGIIVSLQATPPLKIFRPVRARAGHDLVVRTDGVRLRLKVPKAGADGTTGALTAQRNGVIVAAVPYTIDARANRSKPDVTVPSRQAATIQAAIDGVSDRNRDGTLAIAVGPGLYRENLIINRPVSLRGAGPGVTLVQASGAAAAISVAAPGVHLRGVTAVGGTAGITLSGGGTSLSETHAWHNTGAGLIVSAPNPQLWRISSESNGGDGLQLSGAANAVCADMSLVDNRGGGAVLSGLQGGRFTGNQVVDNAASGVSLVSVDGVSVTDNQSVNNLGSGFELFTSQRSELVENLSALNDEDGLSLESTNDNLLAGNVFDSNHGYGLFVRRSTDDDFAAAPGLQAPPGDNTGSNNRKGDVFVRPD